MRQHVASHLGLEDPDASVPGILIEHARILGRGERDQGESNKIYLRNGKIADAVFAGEEVRGAIRVDAGGGILVPGFIDLHIHGTGPYLVDDGRSSLEALGNILPRYGVTGFLPSLCPSPKEKHIALVAELARVQSMGSRILGFFAEGPFLSVPGSLAIADDQIADAEWVTLLQAAAAPYRVVFAISPEFPGIRKLYDLMTAQGMPMFITHTRAGVGETLEAINSGARHATHFYDVFPHPEAMEPGVRPCGAVEAILSDPSVSVDFILDGEHVDPIAVKMALASKGVEKVCLITDANRGAGLPPGKPYAFGGATIFFAHEGAPARLGPDHPTLPGALAGSGLTMDQAVRNAVALLGMDLYDAVTMASLAPAKVLGLGDRKGKVECGYDADLVLLDPKTLRPLRTWVGGREVFNIDNETMQVPYK